MSLSRGNGEPLIWNRPDSMNFKIALIESYSIRYFILIIHPMRTSVFISEKFMANTVASNLSNCPDLDTAPARWDEEKGSDPEFTSWTSAIDQQEQKTTLMSTLVSVTTSLWQRLYWHFWKKCAVSMFGSSGATRQIEQVTEPKTLIQQEKKKTHHKKGKKIILGEKRWKHRVQRG